jgi:hypothetical protein
MWIVDKNNRPRMGSAWQSPLTDDSARSGNPRGDEAVVGKPSWPDD